METRKQWKTMQIDIDSEPALRFANVICITPDKI